METNREELIEVLKKVQPALEAKQISEGPPSFVFDEHNIMSFNELMLVQYPFESKLDCTVPSEELYKLLNSMSAAKIDLSFIKSKWQVLVKTKNVLVKIKCSSNELSVDKIGEIISDEKKYRRLPKDFVEGLRACLFSASTDLSQAMLCCLYIKGDKIVSSDNIRISEFTMSRELKDSFLIPAKIVRELVKFNIVKYRVVGSMIHFKTSDGVFVSSILHADKYYEVSEHFKFSGETVNFPKEMRKVMPTIAVMVEAEELSAEPQYIDVEISKDGIICESSKDLGSVRSEFKCKTKLKKSTSFKIKPEVLEKILDHTSRVKIGKAKALFEIDNFRHLAALVK